MFIIPSKFNSGTKKTASRELDLHQQSFLNPTDEIQRYPTDSALQPAPSGRTAFTAPDFHDRVHTDRNKLNPVIIGSWTFPDIQIRNADLHQERHLTRRPCRSSRTAAMPTARPTFLKAVNKLLETKDAVVANGYAMIPVLFDTTALEAEHDELL